MKRMSYLVAGFAILLLVGQGCARSTDNQGNTPQNGEMQEVSVGLLMPLSGDAASYGESVRQAVDLAIKDLGLDNINLVTGDSKCDGKEAAAEIQKMINTDGVVAIVGELCSGATLAAAPIAEQNKVVMVSPASTAPTVSEAGEYIYRTVPSDALQGAFGAELVYDSGHRKLAVLYVNDDYGVGFDDVLNDVFPKLGGEVVASEAVERQATDVRTQLTKIKAAEPDAIYIISNSPDTAVAAIKQIDELGIEAVVYGSEGLKSDDVLEAAGSAAEDLVLTTVSGGNDTFMKAHQAMYDGAAPGPFAAQGYDAMFAIGQAIKDGAGTGEEIKNFLDSLTFDGVTGSITFDNNGDVSGIYDVFVVESGEFMMKGDDAMMMKKDGEAMEGDAMADKEIES